LEVYLFINLELFQEPLQLLSLLHMPQAGTVHLFIFIQPIDCFIPGDIPELFIIRKNIFLVFDGEEFSFGHIIKYEKLFGDDRKILLFICRVARPLIENNN
jgi:hypothetical protein